MKYTMRREREFFYDEFSRFKSKEIGLVMAQTFLLRLENVRGNQFLIGMIFLCLGIVFSAKAAIFGFYQQVFAGLFCLVLVVVFYSIFWFLIKKYMDNVSFEYIEAGKAYKKLKEEYTNETKVS